MVRRGLVITIYPNGTLGFREQKRRREYTVPAVRVYALAVQSDLEHQKAEKRKARGLKPQVRRGLLR